VLTQPSRARLFEQLSGLRRPAATDELATLLGLHPNGVRAHLERLLEAGLVVRERPRQPVGRPRDMWSIAPDAQPGGEPPSSYSDLGRWLASALPHGRTGLREIEATGREIGRGLAPRTATGSAEQRVRGVLTSLGFAPKGDVDTAGALTYRLCNCPYRDVAREDQQVVCTLHRGLTQGLLDVIAPDATMLAFVARDPETAGCEIKLDSDLADQPR
jgi:predicted ArsR family transcriptional regulator